MATKVQYIEKRRNKYWFKRAVPKAHKDNPFFAGCGTNYAKNLQTDSLSLAIQRKEQILVLWDKAVSGNPRDVYDVARKSIDELDYKYDPDAYMDKYDCEIDFMLDTWRSKYPLDAQGHPIGVSEVDHAQLAALFDSREVKKTGEQVANPYPMSLQEACEHTVETKRGNGMKENGLNKFGRAVRFLEESEGGLLGVAEINRALVKRFIKAMKAEGKTDKTIKGYLTCLSQIWEEARDLEEVSEERINPFREHGLKDDSIPYDMLQSFQVKQILEQELLEEDRLLYLMGYYTGARVSELLKLKSTSISYREGENGELVKCILFSKKTIENRRGGKTVNATRFIPIHSSLEPCLDGFDGFTTSYDPFDKRRRKLFKELFGEDSGGHLVFHSLRHTFLTQLINQTKNEVLAKQLIGHSKSNMGVTGLYYHGAGLQELKEAVESIPSIK